MPILQGIPKHADGYVFHGPRGARLKADTVRNRLVRDVLAPSFPTPKVETGFADGRLHSFRHFFGSLFAIDGASRQVVMQYAVALAEVDGQNDRTFGVEPQRRGGADAGAELSGDGYAAPSPNSSSDGVLCPILRTASQSK